MMKKMKMKRNNHGFTMAELLIVVAITVILMGVAFVGVQNYQRSMTRLEDDTIAKEIFIAAQNHLTSAQSQGYLQLGTKAEKMVKELGTLGTNSADTHEERYFLYSSVDKYSSDPQKAESVLDLMLPFGAIDETVRAGGTYIIRYQPATGQVLDVFYSRPAKSSMLTVSGVNLAASDYSTLMDTCRGDSSAAKQNRESFGVVGWYGGGEGIPIGTHLEPPELKIHNEDTLWVEVTDTNGGKGSLKLIVTGAISGAQTSFDLRNISSRVENGSVTLDDITRSGFHFADLGSENDKHFIPGEDVIVEAIAYNNAELSNIASSGKKTTNSLFANLRGKTEAGVVKHTAGITSFRHLENLDAHISKLEKHDNNDTNEDTKNKLNVVGATQTANIDWNKFRNNPKISSRDIVPYEGNDQQNDCYLPVTPRTYGGSAYNTFPLVYDGGTHSVSNVKVNFGGNAGMFGELMNRSAVSNLKLIDFNVTGTTSAAALVGTATGTTVTNVITYHTEKEDAYKTATVTASSGSAGGLIGSMSGGKVEKCGAALVVSGSTNAGGLIGSTTGGEVKASYSGGHTYSGNPNYTGTTAPDPARTPNAVRYYDENNNPIYNVNASSGNAGGLIGNAGNTEISNSYSTCSAKGATAGGFVGTGTGKMTNCYCTGLVEGTNAKGAFTGASTANAEKCKYFEIINEVPKDNDKSKGYEYLPPLQKTGDEENAGTHNEITAFDDAVETYEAFCGGKDAWQKAEPYDNALKQFYHDDENKPLYNLKTVKQLGASVSNSDFVATHYGDWPAPEEFVFN